jgi:hypothetical protein
MICIKCGAVDHESSTCRPWQERFWLNVDKNGPTMEHMETRCWLWTGYKHVARPGEYGQFEGQRAHRFSLEKNLGRKLVGKEMSLHHCDNPPCVRPDHLYAGTAKNNYNDMVARGRRNVLRGADWFAAAGKLHLEPKTPEKVRAYGAKWREAHPENITKSQAKQKAAKTAAA